ncbi:MAG: NEW3 domain-containing protein [Candidatus Latescibacterota bacterium]
MPASLTKEQQLSKLQLQESLLQLEERRASLDTHAEELRAAQELFDQGFFPLQKLKQTQNRYHQARLDHEKAVIDLEQKKLDLLTTATHLVVTQARRYRTADGRSMADVTLANFSNVQDALVVDPALSEAELRSLLKVESIYVSLHSGAQGNAIVGEPYEQRIDSLGVGQERLLTFRLLAEVEAVVVALKYLDLPAEALYVTLKKGSLQDLPTINSAQFSQEGELGQTVSFGLTLERLGDEERSFALAAIGVPARITHSFVNDAGARVSQVKFDQSISKVQLQLRLEIPDRLDRALVGRTRPIYALVTHPSQYAQINELRARHGDEPVPESQVEALGAPYVRMELIPKGLGKLEVLVANRYQEVQVGEELNLRVEFHNRGTVAVQNIKAVLDLPYEWESHESPSLIKLLEPGERSPVDIVARPPADIAVGEYEVGIEARGQVGTEDVESLEKNITVRIGARSNLAGNAVLIGVLVLLVLGIGIASVRISRR